MLKNRIIYLLLLTGSIVLSIAYENKATLIFAAALLLIPLCSLICAIIARLSVKLYLSPEEALLPKGQSQTCVITAVNRSIFPVYPLYVTARLIDENRRIILGIPPLGVVRSEVVGSYSFRGEYSEGVYTFVLYDLLKLFSFTGRVNAKFDAVVLPRKLKLGKAESGERDDGATRALLTASDQYDFSTVREYREGDSLKAVHWKLSAKQTELVVKQRERGVSPETALFADLSLCSSDEETARSALDLAIEAALAITDASVARGETVRLFYNGNDGLPSAFTAESAVDYQQLFRILAVYRPSDTAFSLLRTISDFKKDYTACRTIYVIVPFVDEKLMRMLIPLGKELGMTVKPVICSPTQQNESLLESLSELSGITAATLHHDTAEAELSALFNCPPISL